MNEEQPMLAKITKGKECKWRFWQEDSYTEFTHTWMDSDGEVHLIYCKGKTSYVKATIKGSSTREFLRCFEIVKGKL